MPVWAEDPRDARVVERRSFSLRPYQVDCFETYLATLKGGKFSRIGVSAPTGKDTFISRRGGGAEGL